jgi:hypothetical protein
MAAIDLAKGKLSRAEFIRRAIAKAVERELHSKLKRTGASVTIRPLILTPAQRVGHI